MNRMTPNQERLVAVLKDTISLLCRNSLSYDQQMVVQGLICVTVDKQDVVVVQVNDEIGDTDFEPCAGCGHSRRPKSTPRERKKRRRPSDSEDEDDDDDGESNSKVPCPGSQHSTLTGRIDTNDDKSKVKSEHGPSDSEDETEPIIPFHGRLRDLTGKEEICQISDAEDSFQMDLDFKQEESPGYEPNDTLKLPTEQITNKANAQSRNKYTCSWKECGKIFIQMTHLNEHVSSVHMKMKPFCCPSDGCKQTIATLSSLTRHVNKMHPQLNLTRAQIGKMCLEKHKKEFAKLCEDQGD